MNQIYEMAQDYFWNPRLKEWMSCAQVGPIGPTGITVKEIKNISDKYVANMRAAIGLPNLIGLSVAEGEHLGLLKMMAYQNIFGAIKSLSEVQDKIMLRRYRTTITKLHNGRLVMPNIPSYENATDEVFARVKGDATRELRNMMLAQFVLAYSAFETMSRDLWEAAVNVCPDRLAPTGNIHIDRNLVKSKSDYDFTRRAGTALLKKGAFQKLKGIRDEYENSFREHNGRINVALGNKSLDALSVVRNVIVHKGGTIDTEYQEGSRGLKAFLPKLRIAQRLTVNGRMVAKIIIPAQQSGLELIQAVQSWLIRFGEVTYVKLRYGKKNVAT
jgi:hypothetical protein